MKRLIFIVTVTLLAIVGFTFANKSKAGATNSEETEEMDMMNIPLNAQQVKTVDLKMGPVEQRELDATIKVNGQLVLRAQNKGDVASLMGGVIKSILVKEGQPVRKGQVMAWIENTDVVSLQREYYSATKECEMARLEMDRQQTLDTKGAGIKRNVQQTRKDYQVARANLIGISRQLAQMGISPAQVGKGKFTTVFPLRAPISGTVSEITGSLGSYADMQTPIMKIRNNSAVECDLNVFEKDINKVKPGDRVLLSLTNQPGVKVSGYVYGMNEYFNDGTKSVAVHVRLNGNHTTKLFDGMYVNGQIATGRQECKVLPSKAIVTTDGKTYIFALNREPLHGQYSFSRHEITTGISQDGYTEVELCKHIQRGQKIVTDNAFYLASLTGNHGEED